MRRCFGLLDGYESRYELTKRVEAEFPGGRVGDEATQKLDVLKIRNIRRDLERAAERFFEACAENGLLGGAHFQTIDELLDLALYESPRNDAYFEMVDAWRS